MTIPIILVMAIIRYVVHPSEESFSFYFLTHQVQGPLMGWPEFAFAIFYALVMCPIQQFIVRCGMQVPVTAALGPHKLSSVFWGNFAASVAFSIIHLPYSKLAVLLTFMVSFYWGGDVPLSPVMGGGFHQPRDCRACGILLVRLTACCIAKKAPAAPFS